MSSIDLRCKDCERLGVLCPKGKAHGKYRCAICRRTFDLLWQGCADHECAKCGSTERETITEEWLEPPPGE